VSKDLIEAFEAVVAGSLPPQRYVAAHRWRYGQCSELDERRMLFDPKMGLAVCGDWLAGGRVEVAFLAGIKAADAIREHRDQELHDL
jgi:predicted NAD/FAD-dependent oxidoreductase